MKSLRIKDNMTDKKLHSATVCFEAPMYHKVLRCIDWPVDAQIAYLYMRVLDQVLNEV